MPTTSAFEWLKGYERRKPPQPFKYVIVNSGGQVDLFKSFTNGGSVHLAEFGTLTEAMAFVASLPMAPLVLL